MGHGPSSSSVSATRTTQGRNGSIIQSNPDPQRLKESSPGSRNGSVVNEPGETLKSKSYMNYRQSTASLSKIFQKKRWKKRRGSISASFNINENDIQVELLNANTATEEELMTLNGVNRTLAQAIILHREVIGGFRKLEDLALVSGMGASKLDQIRPEICIARRKPGLSLASSRYPSVESIPNSIAESSRVTGSVSSRFSKMININTASIFDLMGVDGINQALAAKIIINRDKRGPFRCVDDLRRVGISYRLLSALKVHLTTEEFDSDKSSTISYNSPLKPPRRGGHARSISVPVDGLFLDETRNSTTVPGTRSMPQTPTAIHPELSVIYDLMSIKTKRPSDVSNFNFYYNEYPAYRVASWNLEQLTKEKIGNPGVMEVITRTILENGFSILAVQEICDKNILGEICEELNNPKLSHNRSWTQYRGIWKFALHPTPMNSNQTANYLGVIYDSIKIDEICVPPAQDFCPIQNGCLWQYAVFKVKVCTTCWILVNVLSMPLESNGYVNGHVGSSNQNEVRDSVKSLIEAEGTEGALITGFFTAKQALKGLSDVDGLEMVLPGSKNLDAVDEAKPNSLWVTSSLKKYLTGNNGTVENGLSHYAIPNGWSYGGKISQHGPLWYTLYSVPVEKPTDQILISPSYEESDADDSVPTR